MHAFLCREEGWALYVGGVLLRIVPYEMLAKEFVLSVRKLERVFRPLIATYLTFSLPGGLFQSCKTFSLASSTSWVRP